MRHVLGHELGESLLGIQKCREREENGVGDHKPGCMRYWETLVEKV